jgi:hypothetical protein
MRRTAAVNRIVFLKKGWAAIITTSNIVIPSVARDLKDKIFAFIAILNHKLIR